MSYSQSSTNIQSADNQGYLKRLGKEIVFKKRFPISVKPEDLDKTFFAYHNAIDWLKENGIDYGSMERCLPIGLCRNADISKWSKLKYGPYEYADDAKNLEGIMVCDGSFREGSVEIWLTFDPEKINE